MGAGRYRTAHGAHRPVCNGRYLVAHVGGMNCVPWNFVLFTAPVVACRRTAKLRSRSRMSAPCGASAGTSADLGAVHPADVRTG